jgi:hypothetical protein
MCPIGPIRALHPGRCFYPARLPPLKNKKNPHGFRRAGLSLVYSDSRLAVAFLNGYVVNSVLAPDLYQGLAITTLTSSRLGKVLS